jgi:hypothetical protein
LDVVVAGVYTNYFFDRDRDARRGDADRRGERDRDRDDLSTLPSYHHSIMTNGM